jgi:hypothetical protein
MNIGMIEAIAFIFNTWIFWFGLSVAMPEPYSTSGQIHVRI